MKWIHVVGICGVTTAQIANMFKKKGWFVTGSDKGFFPPMSDYCKKRGLDIELGFKKKHLTKDYYKAKVKSLQLSAISHQPDLVMVGNYAGLKNEEYQFAKKKGLQIKSYPEILNEYILAENSIVTAGTFGKTTTAALLALIFKKAGKKPSFMIGGLAKNFADGVVKDENKWSVIEGDEYISARFDPKSKFFHYEPEFLLLTSCAWEHTDFFKTEQEYVDNFKKLVEKIPKNGLIVANRVGENVKEVLKVARCKVVTYELNNVDENIAQSTWFNLSHKENKENGEIVIFNKNTQEEFELKTQLIGDHNRENIVGCVALARELGISAEVCAEAVADFKGIKRRLEVRFSEKNIKILDDFACSPPKVEGSLSALRNEFPEWHITIVYEPNVGNRTRKSLELFKGLFNRADEVVIPHLKPVKTKSGVRRVSGQELAEKLKDFGANAKYIEDDDRLVKYISEKKVGKHIICFMGAYGWRKMIVQTINKFS